MGALFTQYKTYIFVAAGIAAALVAWWSLSSGGESNAILTAENTAGVSSGEKDLVDTLLQLRAVSLSGTIFSDPGFARLRDFGTQIIPEPVGRPNPFSPYTTSATSTGGTSAQLFSPQTP